MRSKQPSDADSQGLRMRDPCWELPAWRARPRGVSRDGGVRRVWVRVRTGGRGTARWCFRGPYCRSGWWVVALMGCPFGLCRGRRMVPWSRRAGCGWSLGTGARGGDVGVGAHGADGLVGPGAGGISRGSGTCLCGRAVRRCVCGARRRSDWRAAVPVGLLVGLCRSCWWVAACGRVGWCLG